MFGSIFRSWCPCIAIVGAALVGPLATADTPSGFDTTTRSVQSLHLDGDELAFSTLGNIRGGFELTPNLTINFGFSQIDTLNQSIVQSIIVPTTTLTETQNNATVVISGSGGTSIAQLQMSGADPSITGADSGDTNSPSDTAGTTNVQLSPSSISITSSANQGQTAFLTQLTNSGITNVVQNEANNQLIQQVTTISIGISGMSQWLSQQRTNASVASEFSGQPGF
jgi:hypothetical protein